MPIAKVNGVNLYYEVAGKGNAVVFLHGMTGSNKDWANQMHSIVAKVQGYCLGQSRARQIGSTIK